MLLNSPKKKSVNIMCVYYQTKTRPNGNFCEMLKYRNLYNNISVHTNKCYVYYNHTLPLL